MVDTHVSGACGEIRGGSSPPIDNFYIKYKKFKIGTQNPTKRSLV